MPAAQAAIPDSRIYVVTHVDHPIDPVPGLVPIYAGPAAANAPAGALTDVRQDGTALDNARWSELSAIHRIWQDGPRAGRVGFCHYRRYFNFGHPDHRADISEIDRRELQAVRAFTFDAAQIAAVGPSLAIVARPQQLDRPVPDHYRESHIFADYEKLLSLCAEKFPDIAKHMAAQHDRELLYACNLFVLSWPDFDALCAFWFALLEDFAATTPWPRGQGAYQDRDVAFLSERLFDAWIRHRQANGLALLELPIFFVI